MELSYEHFSWRYRRTQERLWRRVFLTLVLAVLLGGDVVAIAMAATVTQQAEARDPIVGAWMVQAKEAPFPAHMLVFHADEILRQSDPDEADPDTSDSDGVGTWRRDGQMIVGTVTKVTANRASRHVATLKVISLRVSIIGGSFAGVGEVNAYDMAGKPLGGRLGTSLEGTRVFIEPIPTSTPAVR